MPQSLVDIGHLITTSPDIQEGRAVIAGTGTSVRRIVALYRQGYDADEIVADKDYLTLAQVYAALAYYHANPQAIQGKRICFFIIRESSEPQPAVPYEDNHHPNRLSGVWL